MLFPTYFKSYQNITIRAEMRNHCGLDGTNGTFDLFHTLQMLCHVSDHTDS